MMLCCEKEVQIPDLSAEIKLEAMDEVRQKNIITDLYFLTACANPYGISGVVIQNQSLDLTVHYCGELVFVWSQGYLKRYICHENGWADIIADEAKRIRDDRNIIRLQDAIHQTKNEMAKRNYVIC